MYALELRADAASSDGWPYVATIHVDRGVQVEEALLGSECPTPNPNPNRSGRASLSEEELTAVMAGRGGASSSSDAARRAATTPSPFWPVDDEAEEGGVLSEEEPEPEPEEEEEDSPRARPIEREEVGFVAGHPLGELVVGSIGFYRFDEPAGVHGLRPPPLRSNVVCLMDVPSYLGSSDLIRFLGGYIRYVHHMRLLRDTSMPHRHMLLLQFGSPGTAERFRRDFHAKRYNSLEPEVAFAVHVAQVQFAPPQPRPRPLCHVNLRLRVECEGVVSAAALGPCGECSDRQPAPAAADPAVRTHIWLSSERVGARSVTPPPSTVPLPPPSAEEAAAVETASRGKRALLPSLPLGSLLGAVAELPSCPVCLERLDPSITGIFTIVCDHTFHCECLRRWSDSSCPVCRHVADDSQSATCCESCGRPGHDSSDSAESLWICLVCGHVGCGRYGCRAGVIHNERTEHRFAMELNTQRVWDYQGDNFVHRLIQSKVDGKLVELPDARPSAAAGSSAADGMMLDGERMDPAVMELKQRGFEEQYEAVVHEYSLLLTGQLEVQRAHYEERLDEIERRHKRQSWELEQNLREREEELAQERAAVEKEAARAAKQVTHAEKSTKEREFNKQLNEQLMRNQAAIKEKLAEAEREAAELRAKNLDMEEQLRDMTFHFESQLKIMGGGLEGGEELSGGAVSAPEATPKAKGKRKAVAKGSR